METKMNIMYVPIAEEDEENIEDDVELQLSIYKKKENDKKCNKNNEEDDNDDDDDQHNEWNWVTTSQTILMITWWCAGMVIVSYKLITYIIKHN